VDDKSDRADADADAATAAAAVLVSLSARTGGEVGDAPEILVADAEQGSATADRAAGVCLQQQRGRRGPHCGMPWDVPIDVKCGVWRCWHLTRRSGSW
jgi:hypothetical protein